MHCANLLNGIIICKSSFSNLQRQHYTISLFSLFYANVMLRLLADTFVVKSFDRKSRNSLLLSSNIYVERNLSGLFRTAQRNLIGASFDYLVHITIRLINYYKDDSFQSS